MRNDPFGQGQYEQGGAPRRRGLFGNVRWLILLGFATILIALSVRRFQKKLD